MSLEKYFKSETDWKDFSRNYNEKWAECPFKEELLEKVRNNKEIAVVIYGTVEDGAFNYLNSNIPALDGLTPLECLESKDTIKRLKVALMRMPC